MLLNCNKQYILLRVTVSFLFFEKCEIWGLFWKNFGSGIVSGFICIQKNC